MNKNIDNNTNFNSPFRGLGGRVLGAFIQLYGEKYYQITNHDAMQPFFISLASDSNHWMYISSTGGLSAGRKNPDSAIFPYYTDDKISESAEITGSKTILHAIKNGKKHLWEPFSERQAGSYTIKRSIAKSVIGNKLIFTEKNVDLDLTFSYTWMNADEFGWIKKSSLTNESAETLEVYVVDGLQNVLPSGVDRQTQNTYSTLVDGYKKTELVEGCGLVLFRMESILVDKAEPSESLRANTVWSYGLETDTFLLSSSQLTAIRSGQKAQPETESKGVRGAIFACANVLLKAKTTKNWYFVAEVQQDSAQVNNCIDFIQNTIDIPTALELNIAQGTHALQNIVAQADGIQHTADEHGSARHFANVLFNTMRGGIYSEGYTIQAAFFNKHIQLFNKNIWAKHQDFLKTIPDKIDYKLLNELVSQQNDPQLQRLFLEYLPLTFSRRHGDPSRPWNSFDINVKDENGDKLLSYQGNWRDIFQNWEALSLSYPGFVNGIIAKFVNATTADGYNAYRLTNTGIEWEEIEPDNPWSNIGYWGDHQIIYLQKLLEIAHNHYPAELETMLSKEIYVFANIPYRLKSHAEIVAQPKDTIHFDSVLHHQILRNEAQMGADAKLVLNEHNEPVLVTFTEKLLATLLAKLSNFIPEAGIWLNTQRPEWNDANNALVGTGASMVTVYYLRRYVAFAKQLFEESSTEKFEISNEMFVFFEDVFSALIDADSILTNGCDASTRRKITDELGFAGEKFRNKIYNGFSGQKNSISKTELVNFFELTLAYLDQSITVNKREDNLYHAYNLVKFTNSEIEIRYLYEMLEGQVSVLSAGKLTASEAVEVLNALRISKLYRVDQNSYMLYPNKRLPSFLEKNNISIDNVKSIPLLSQLVSAGDKRIVTSDKKGQYHFNASFNNAGFLHEALLKLQSEGKYAFSEAVIKEIEAVYEQTFDHQSFTGRSGTFYKYEGLGSIYWHMVSKLLLAIGENISWAIEKQEDANLIAALKSHFAEVKAGIGAHKSPAEYGSFPFDPYSHTPIMASVQQPGMTGQVKEDIITRYFELGVVVKNGCIEIHPENIQSIEFIVPSDKFALPYLTFSYCSIPFIYIKDSKENSQKGYEIKYKNKQTTVSTKYQFSKEQSVEIFERNEDILKIEVHI
jgi:hypothetical protein